MTATVLLTGGAGYIGSHTFVALAEAGMVPVIVDDFSNSRPSVTERLATLTGRRVLCERVDVRNTSELDLVFARHEVGSVIHFAAKKSAPESVLSPLAYLDVNISGLISLLTCMERHGVTDLVYSSSAAIYGDTDVLPIPETAPRSAASPYGYTKIVGEQMLEQLASVQPQWRFGVLRYFNPVGAHASGLIGEDPGQPPTNLVPRLGMVAAGLAPEIEIFGDDYDTPDGTGIRDYVHVSDLAEAHVLSLQALRRTGTGHVVNIGTGRGSSVREVVGAYSRACGRELSCSVRPRRRGDVAACYADPRLAEKILGFRARYDLDEMCASSWRWIRSIDPDRSDCR